MFTHALVRHPAENFANGLTTGNLGHPDIAVAREQHARYCQALADCGLELTILEADSRYPDSTFVEDTAVVAERSVVLTNPGAPSRSGEVAAIAPILSAFFEQTYSIAPPGTMDGGDICEAGDFFFIGISQRTNQQGAAQLAEFLRLEGFSTSTIDLGNIPGILHLKSGLAYLGGTDLVVIDALADHPAFQGYRIFQVDPSENYAANCIRVNDFVLFPAGFPILQAQLESTGYRLILLEMSEFQKMDGGLSCLSLRF